MKKSVLKGILLSVFGLSLFLSHGQDLPKFIDISEDQTEIKTEGGEITGFYNESKLRQIYLEFEDPNYWTLLESYYDTENYVKATLYYKNDTLFNVGVQFKGNTSYTKLGADDEKMSFSIKTDQFVEDQDLSGYSNINLNNAYEDNSTMKEVVYAHLCRNHIPAPQANFVELYINGEYWGPYTNVQQVNKDLLEDWFMSNDGASFRAIGQTETTGGGTGTGGPGGGGPGGGGGGGAQWGDGTAALNYHDNDSATYQQYYTLKSSDIEDSWEKLITLCDVLNNTPIGELEETLEDYLDIDRTLWFLAHEIIYSDDDSYIYKGEMDYYVYYEPETGRSTPLEFDGNSAMDIRNVSWDIFMNEDDENFPLLNRLLSIPSLRQRYLAHVRTILDEEMVLESVFELIDNYAALIDSSVQADPKKLITYQEYLDGVDELKEYFTTRKSFLTSDAEVNVTGTSIYGVSQQANEEVNSLPYAGDQMNITASVETGNVSAVNLYYSNEFVGKFSKVTMYDDGNHNDGSAGDGVYGASIPGQVEGTYVRYYIEAVSSNGTNTASYLPVGAEHHSFIYKVRYSEVATSDLVINELMASNDFTIADNMGEYDDWIELYNNSSAGISLFGYYLTDNVDVPMKFELPDVTIDANGYVLIWADEDGEQGEDHASFKLDADGEDVFLVDPTGKIIDQVSYSALSTDVSYARTPNGTGNFAALEATPLANNDGLVAGSENLFSTNSIQLYPNPANDVLNINLGNLQSASLEIIDITGVSMWSDQITDSVYSLNTNDFKTGIYIVRINNEAFKIEVN